jgi:arylsulfatase A-like enzyme
MKGVAMPTFSKKLFTALILLGGLVTAADKKPNILFIFSDDHSTEAIGAYGSKINKTPNIDRIANEGAIFNNSFCGNSICQPSRASILSGAHSHVNGVIYNGAKWDGEQLVFPRLLKKAGYNTALVGKWHMHPNPTTEFDYWKVLSGSGGQGDYFNPDFVSNTKGAERIEGYCPDVITDEALSWLNKRDEEKPFLMMVQYKSPHVPRIPHWRYMDRYTEDIAEPSTLHDDYKNRLPGASTAWMEINGQNEEILAAYPPKDSKIKIDPFLKKKYLDRMTEDQRTKLLDAMDAQNSEYYKLKESGAFNDERAAQKYKYQFFIKNYLRCIDAIDDNVGRLLTWLEEQGLDENTIVIYSSDQSYFIGEHGWAEKRWMYEESMKMPFMIRWPGKIQAGSRPESMIQNIDYGPTFLSAAGLKVPARMQGESMLPLFEQGDAANWRESVYYHYYHHGQHNVPRHEGIRTDRYKLINFYTDGKYELYDLKNDPKELRSLADSPEHQSLKADLIKQLQGLRDKFELPKEHLQKPWLFGK